MNKTKKISLAILAVIALLVLLLLFGGSFVVHKVIVGSLGADFTYLQTMQGLITGNAEGESEKEFKRTSMREDHGHISIYYEENFSEMLPVMKESLDAAIERTDDLLGKTERVPFDLFVFENYVEMNAFASLERAEAFYSDFHKVLAIQNAGKELILADDELAIYHFQREVIHEYAHYAFYRRVSEAGHYPTWFMEGVAEYAENDPERVFFPHFTTIPFDQLDRDRQWTAAMSVPLSSPYMQSYYALVFLTEEYGEGVITELIDSVDETKDFEESFAEITGLTLEELEEVYLLAYKG